MKKFLLINFLTLTIGLTSFAQLGIGSLMFVGFNADGIDGIAFAAMENIPAGTTIYFTDNEWNGSAFNTGESYWQWSSGSVLTAGSVVVITNIDRGTLSGSSLDPVADMGTCTWSTTSTPNNSSGLATNGEVVYMYLAASYNSTPDLFITAIASGNYNPSNGELTGTGLTEGVNCLQVLGNDDVLVYEGPIECGGTLEECLANLSDPDNWLTDNGSGDESIDGDAPDFPADIVSGITLSFICPIPSGLTVSALTSTSATLSWDAIAGVSGYYFQFENDATGPNKRRSMAGESNTSISIPSGVLVPGNLYVWGVSTVCEPGFKSDWTTMNYFTTPLRLAGEVADIAILYPNPSNGNFSIRFPESVEGMAQVQVLDLTGKVVASYQVDESMISQPVQVSLATSGVYHVMITSGTASWVERIIVQ